jgi:SRSO17 transposase
MAENIGEETPYRLQQFLYRGQFSADSLRDELRSYVGEKLGQPEGVLVVDDTGFLKQGKKSCGVKRQYTGTAGKIANCQIGVFLTYAGDKGHAPIDRRLYLPEEWCEDMDGRREAGIPEEVTFHTKPEIALEMIREATASGVPYTWVTGDCAYGDYWAMRRWLEEHGKCYVLCVSGKEHVWLGARKIRVSEILQSLPEEGWFEASCGDGSKGARVYDWMCFDLHQPRAGDFTRSMLVRRSKANKDDMQAFACCAPKNTPDEKLAETAGVRWTVERCFAEAKSEVGMDHYEVRTFNGWYKHITLACLALALITVLSAYSLDMKPLQAHNPDSHSLDAFKRGRNLLV